MKNPRSWLVLMLFVSFLVLNQVFPVFAADQTGDFLNYQEPKSSGSSWFSTIAYLFSLLFTFVVVIGLAYVTSRFLGQRLGKSAVVGENKVIFNLPLGPNRGVYIVEIAGRFLVLGVTDHNINVLQEISDPAEVEKLQNMNTALPATQFDAVLQRHLNSLQQMSQRFPGVFGGYNRSNSENDREKR
ncbi:MAG: flagellar biosynthetic protein FliO [Negativicutes bacterium]|nr:flagellar biosynthetic protein FliO [Negativicutes bacterium]